MIDHEHKWHNGICIYCPAKQKETERNIYLETVARLEPEIAMIDAEAFYASAAISLKRIADFMAPHTYQEMSDTISFQEAESALQSICPSNQQRECFAGQLGDGQVCTCRKQTRALMILKVRKQK